MSKKNQLNEFYKNFTEFAEKVKTLPQDAKKVQELRQKRRKMNNDAYNKLIKGK